MKRTHLSTGIAIREGRLLMVASRYPNHAEPLWNLPGGRQQAGELLEETVVREVFEETAVRVEAREIAYVTESYDGDAHFLNVTFKLVLRRASVPRADANDPDRAVGDHVAAVEWVPLAEVGDRILVGVVREPLLGYLRGSLKRRYAGFHAAGITIEWPPDSR